MRRALMAEVANLTEELIVSLQAAILSRPLRGY